VLRHAEFNTIRLKIVVRVVEHGSRIRAHLPTSCPEQALFCHVSLALTPSG
jgi:hypothetical protein